MVPGVGGRVIRPPKGPKHYGKVLRLAEQIINNDRREDYGPAETSFKQIAAVWSAYLGIEVSSKDVALCMALFKICREKANHKLDNLVDAAGYIALAEDVLESE